jgi:hypothetical protein
MSTNYNNILDLKREIQNIEREIENEINSNEKLSQIINSDIEKNKDEMNKICALNKNYAEKIKLEKLISDTENELKKTSDELQTKINLVQEQLKTITKNIDETHRETTIDYSPTLESIQCNEKIEKIITKLRSQLLQKIGKIANITDKTIFNINLSKVLSENSSQNDWIDKLSPEQVSVLLGYVYSITQLFIKYYQMTVRYVFYPEYIFDPVTDYKFKLFEKNYKQFKQNKTLDQTIVCLRVMLIDLIYLSGKKISSQEETQWDLLELLNKLITN